MENFSPKHSVHKIYQERLSRSTKPFNARGAKVVRCEYCRIDRRYCMCDLKPATNSHAGFMLLFYDDEVLKPSNTGKLIADLFDDTVAFIWQRKQVSEALLHCLSDPQWFPIVVFPSEYVPEGRPVFIDKPVIESGKRPLFILLDGSWREAKKMFRSSPYLDRFPVLSITAERKSTYLVRKAAKDHQLATAEVASAVLQSIGENNNSMLLSAWFNLFSFRYQQGVQRSNRGNPEAEQQLREIVEKLS